MTKRKKTQGSEARAFQPGQQSSRHTRGEEQFQPSALHRKSDSTPIQPRTEAQKRYLRSILTNKLTFGIGPAGTGKTYIAGSVAADLLRDGKAERMIFTRSAVEAGQRLGFLPGTKEEKFDPYFRPYREVVERRLGSGAFQYALKAGQIEAAPLGLIRGWTFSDCVVVLDEAQNCTVSEMKLFLTRIGENCTVIVSGDHSPFQCDIPEAMSGLHDAMGRCYGLAEVGVVEFTAKDIVRSGLVQAIVESYSRPPGRKLDLGEGSAHHA